MATRDNHSSSTPVLEKNGRSHGPCVIVKFHDFVELPYVDGVEKEFERRQIGPWSALEREFPHITFRRLYTTMEPNAIQTLVDRATELDPTYRPTNLTHFFVVDCPPEIHPQALAKALAAWPTVELAYQAPIATDPVVNALDDPRAANQGYLNAAPDGVNARYAWTVSGGDGAGQRFIDLEQGWTLNHEDLTAHGPSVLFGAVVNSSRPHGTAVLGEITAVDNALGDVGIVPNLLSVNVVSHSGNTANVPNGILTAVANLEFGHVLLLEVQLNFLPCDSDPACYAAIRLATALGIVVVEAAGNGSSDLDAFTDATGHHILNRGNADFKDSGAIMVGAGSSAAPHTRLNFSNFGSRVDCYGWGENVDSCSSNAGGATTLYTSSFNGTSSASPIVTGAALAVQGMMQSAHSRRLSPRQLRAILSNPANGTASSNPAVDKIGVMPDLQTIASVVLGVSDDVFLRDYVGDTGDPHTGAVSASPDIILRTAAVADPQAAFGAGSGTENSNTLGDTADNTLDNFVYVRVLNRGGSPAVNVAAQVYFSPPATLVTPDLWTPVGSVTIPNVPVGNVLTVSDAITWHQADIPAPGHYCFVGLIGDAGDPPPNPADFMNWDNFVQFIRANNNVTWRNFNVVGSDPATGDPEGFVALPFLAPGPPDKARRMRLEIVARLPEGSRAWLEAPEHFIDACRERSPFVKVDAKHRIARLPLFPHGRTALGEMLFPAKSRTQLRLLVHIPEKEREKAFEVYARQMFEEIEVGRLTWRLVRPQKPEHEAGKDR